MVWLKTFDITSDDFESQDTLPLNDERVLSSSHGGYS